MSTSILSRHTVPLLRWYMAFSDGLGTLRQGTTRAVYTTPDSRRLGTFEIQGLIKPGSSKRFAIGDEEFDINSNTWVVGVLEVGSIAKVKGIIKPGMGKFATKVSITKEAKHGA